MVVVNIWANVDKCACSGRPITCCTLNCTASSGALLHFGLFFFLSTLANQPKKVKLEVGSGCGSFKFDRGSSSSQRFPLKDSKVSENLENQHGPHMPLIAFRLCGIIGITSWTIWRKVGGRRHCNGRQHSNIPVNLSPFGEIRLFDVKIGQLRESCRSEEFFFFGGGRRQRKTTDR